MKNDYKKFIRLHKGKIINNEMIELLSQKHEDEIHSMLYNEGLALESINTGKNIVTGDDKDFAVQSRWQTEKEFKTLKGAIRYANK